MPRPKRFKFAGPWLRKLRISKGISRKDLARKMGRSTEDLAIMERGERAIANLTTLRNWLGKLGEPDRFEEAKKLYMIDGDKMELSIQKLKLDERLRLLAIFHALSERSVDPVVVRAIDDAIFSQETITIKRHKQPTGLKPKAGGKYPCVTEFDYEPATAEIVEVREYSKEDLSDE